MVKGNFVVVVVVVCPSSELVSHSSPSRLESVLAQEQAIQPSARPGTGQKVEAKRAGAARRAAQDEQSLHPALISPTSSRQDDDRASMTQHLIQRLINRAQWPLGVAWLPRHV